MCSIFTLTERNYRQEHGLNQELHPVTIDMISCLVLVTRSLDRIYNKHIVILNLDVSLITS